MDAWEELRDKCGKCTGCELSKTRTGVVFGAGNREAKVLFIGEGPGAEEDLRGEPFVGRAGKLLDDMLKIIGLSRDKNIYIANIVKCRPPGNRDPLPKEREACMHWLHAQIELIKPDIIVCLGRIAATVIIEGSPGVTGEFKITRDHGKWYDYNYNGISAKVMAIYHPAALLRDPYKKPDTFVDLKNLEQAIVELKTEDWKLRKVF